MKYIWSGLLKREESACPLRLSSWTVMEIAGLIKALEDKWGVKAAPVAIAGAAGPAAAPAEVVAS